MSPKKTVNKKNKPDVPVETKAPGNRTFISDGPIEKASAVSLKDGKVVAHPPIPPELDSSKPSIPMKNGLPVVDPTKYLAPNLRGLEIEGGGVIVTSHLGVTVVPGSAHLEERDGYWAVVR
jgi:hypothetical protein